MSPFWSSCNTTLQKSQTRKAFLPNSVGKKRSCGKSSWQNGRTVQDLLQLDYQGSPFGNKLGFLKWVWRLEFQPGYINKELEHAVGWCFTEAAKKVTSGTQLSFTGVLGTYCPCWRLICMLDMLEVLIFGNSHSSHSGSQFSTHPRTRRISKQQSFWRSVLSGSEVRNLSKHLSWMRIWFGSPSQRVGHVQNLNASVWKLLSLAQAFCKPSNASDQDPKLWRMVISWIKFNCWI